MKCDLKIATALVGLIVVGFGCSSRSNSDSDWEEVQKAATRVESGLRHETLIALRSKVADLDAAVSNYVRAHGGKQDQRVRSINQAVDALEWAIDHEKSGSIADGTQDFDFYATRPYLDLEPKCWQEDGKLHISETDMARACLAYAQATLLEPDKAAMSRVLDFSALRKHCASDYDSYKNQSAELAEARRVQHSRSWPLQVNITADVNYGFFLGYEIDGERATTITLYPKHVKHIDAKHKVRISVPDDHLEDLNTYQHVGVTVNGKRWIPQWSKSDDYTFETTITIRE